MIALRLHGHLVDGAIAVVDQLLAVLHPRAAAALVAGVGARGRVAATHAGGQRVRCRCCRSSRRCRPPGTCRSSPTAGSQTSILMSESADGLSVAATRQNAGRSVNCAPPPRRRRRRRERAGRDRLRHRDRRVRQLQRRQALARRGRGAAVRAVNADAAQSRGEPTCREARMRALHDPRLRLTSIRQREHVERLPGRRARESPARCVDGTSRGLPPPRPVVTAMYCLPSTLNEMGKPCTDVPSRVCHRILPVRTSTALKLRSRSPTNATPPAVESTDGQERRALLQRPQSPSCVLTSKARELADVAVGARHLVEAPIGAAAAAAARFLLDLLRANRRGSSG